MIYFIDILCTLLFSFIFTQWVFKRPIEIKDKYHKEDWVFPITGAIVAFIIAFICEYILVKILIYYIHGEGKILFLVIKLLDNGILVPFICLLLSKIFKKGVKKYELYYSNYYSHNLTKICFSVIIAVMCFKLLWLEFESYDYNTIDAPVNRIIIWISTVIGTWIGFENDDIKEIKSTQNIKEKIDRNILIFWKPIVVVLVLFSFIILFTDKILKNRVVSICIFLSFIIFVTIMIIDIIMKFVYVYPNEHISEQRYNKLVDEYKNSNGKSRKERFGYMQYWFNNEKIYIKTVKVIYKGHENDREYRRLFNRIKKQIDDNDFESILDYLKERNKRQIAYINKEREKCKQQRINKINEGKG